MRYRVEPYMNGEPMRHGIVDTEDFWEARRAFLISWDSCSYGVKVYCDGRKLTVGEMLKLFKPEGYRGRA